MQLIIGVGATAAIGAGGYALGPAGAVGAILGANAASYIGGIPARNAGTRKWVKENRRGATHYALHTMLTPFNTNAMLPRSQREEIRNARMHQVSHLIDPLYPKVQDQIRFISNHHVGNLLVKTADNQYQQATAFLAALELRLGHAGVAALASRQIVHDRKRASSKTRWALLQKTDDRVQNIAAIGNTLKSELRVDPHVPGRLDVGVSAAIAQVTAPQGIRDADDHRARYAQHYPTPDGPPAEQEEIIAMRAKVRHLLDAYTQQNVAVSKAEFDCIEVFLNKGFSDEASQKWLRHTRAALGPRLIQDSDAPFHLDFIFKDGAISETRVARQRAAWTQHCEENADRLRCAKEILDDLVNLSAGNYDGIRDSQGFVANVLRSRPFTMALLRDLKGKLAAGLYQGAGLNLGLLVPMSLPGALAVLANAGLGGLGFAMTFDPGLQSALVPQIAAGHFPTAANPNGGLSLNVLGAAAGPASAFLMGVVDPAANGIPPAMGAVANLHHAGYDDNDPQFVPAQRDILAHVQQSFPSATREKWGENVVHPSLAVAGFLSGIGGEKHRSRHTQTLREPSDLGLMPSEERAVWNAAIHNAKGSKVAHFLRGFAPRTLRNQLKAGSKGSKRYSDLIASRERYGVAGVVAAEALRRQAAREDHKAGAPQRDQARSDPNYWMHLTRPGSTHGTSRSTALRA